MTSLERITAHEAKEEISKINGRGKWSRRNKFNAVRTILDGVKFDSKKEAQCWQFLKARERAGEIKDLRRQVKFELHAYSQSGAFEPKPVKICTYIADFQYLDVALNKIVVADAKGVKTALFNLKKKLMKANHNIDVELM